MSRITKYQSGIRDFLKNKSFIKNTRQSTRQIIIDMLEESDYFPGILCLTIINNRCKQGGIKMHGYHLASGIEALMMVVKVMNNREYYDSIYSPEEISNMVTDVMNWFYDCLAENINTMRLSNEDKVDVRKLTTIMTKCINYAVKTISKITEQKLYQDYTRMKRTDIFCIDFDEESVENYRTMKRLDQKTMLDNINNTYGMVCRLAVCLGWLIGMGDEQNLQQLETLADHMGTIIKMHDDFKSYKRDMRYGDFCANFIVTHGIKEALILFDDSTISYAEKSVTIGVETKTCNEIVKVITEYINDETQDISVDLDTEFDDMSMASRTSYASKRSYASKGSYTKKSKSKSGSKTSSKSESLCRSCHNVITIN
jgi:hypothetical protein